MCHPGKKGIDFDEFNQSEDRVYEYEYLMNELDTLMECIESVMKQKVELCCYQTLKTHHPTCHFNVLLYGKLTLGTGNALTMARYKALLHNQHIPSNTFYSQHSQQSQSLTIKVYTRHI